MSVQTPVAAVVLGLLDLMEQGLLDLGVTEGKAFILVLLDQMSNVLVVAAAIPL
jgi:hypothetical protein